MTCSFSRMPGACAAICLLYITSTALAFSAGFDYDAHKVRGVNLGGWLVLEPWITPSLFDKTKDDRIVDEYTFAKYQDKAKATAALKQHWDTWIQEYDFEQIAAAGLNHVRIPIGYWAFDVKSGEPYIQGQLPYLEKAVVWAATHKLNVIVDLHGCPGSQNGFDNSGQRMSYPQWHTSLTNVQRCHDVVAQMASKFKDQTSIVAMIAPLNEPAGYYPEILSTASEFWYDSYSTIRYPYGSDKSSNLTVLIHDAFQPISHWNNFMTPATGHFGVALDTHIYQMFSNSLISKSSGEHISNACSHADDLATAGLWVIVGEWTPAVTDCAKYLNGRGTGARYDGTLAGSQKVGSCNGLTGSGASFSDKFKQFLGQMWEAQVMTFEKGQGWIQWTWKAENADEWSYQAGLEYGWIPHDPTNYQHPDICAGR